jgi:hypothetical protein
VEAFVEEVPKLMKKWNVTDTNAHRLIVELKENAIIHGPNQVIKRKEKKRKENDHLFYYFYSSSCFVVVNLNRLLLLVCC